MSRYITKERAEIVALYNENNRLMWKLCVLVVRNIEEFGAFRQHHLSFAEKVWRTFIYLAEI